MRFVFGRTLCFVALLATFTTAAGAETVQRKFLLLELMKEIRSVPAGQGFLRAGYITDAEQRERAAENLRQRREERAAEERAARERSNAEVDRSTNTYGREWLEQQLQGDRPRVIRPW